MNAPCYQCNHETFLCHVNCDAYFEYARKCAALGIAKPVRHVHMSNERTIDIDFVIHEMARRHCGECKKAPEFDRKQCFKCTLFQLLSELLEFADEGPGERGVWYADNTRPKSTKFICSACMKIAYAKPYQKRIPGVGIVKRCLLPFCPNCGRPMIIDKKGVENDG